LKEALRYKLTDETIRTNCWGRILEELLEHKDAAAEPIAGTVLGQFVDGQADKDRALLAAASLMRHAEISVWWPIIWGAIKQDADFGRALVQSVCDQTRPASKFTEKNAADLYLWLIEAFPLEEDPALPMGHAFAVTSRMEITTWRDSFLNDLKSRGTPESLAALEEIASSSPALEKKLHWIMIEARQNVRRHTWQPLTPANLLAFLKVPPASKETLPSFWKRVREWWSRNGGWVFVGAATIMAGLGEYGVGIVLLLPAFVAFASQIYKWRGFGERRWVVRIVKAIWVLAVVVTLVFFGTVFRKMKQTKPWSNLLPTAQQNVP
jgi:hypothetical protein